MNKSNANDYITCSFFSRFLLENLYFWIKKFIPSSTCGVYEHSSTLSNKNGVTTLTLMFFAIGVCPMISWFVEDCFHS